MDAQTELRTGNPGPVIPGFSCQTSNPTGAHWLRNSFNYKSLEQVKTYISYFWGEPELCYRGILSYSTRWLWQSGVSLCFDSDPELREKAHRGRITVDVPGKACEELTATDLLLYIQGCQNYGGRCTRIDVFFDDYNRTICPKDLQAVVDKGDFSLFRIASKNQTLNRTIKKNNGVTYDAVTFGRRGSAGSGKYLRVYDKNLESNGKENCVRWEVEFSQKYAEKAFNLIARGDGNLEVFAATCGGLVGGCISFVKRTGTKHIDRLDVYKWWMDITDFLGVLVVRVSKKKNTLTGMMEWTERQISPTLYVIAKAFRSEQDFYNWMQSLRDIGGGKINVYQRQVLKQNEGCLIFSRKGNAQKQDLDYLNAMCVKVD